jgi:hypothetical protein
LVDELSLCPSHKTSRDSFCGNIIAGLTDLIEKQKVGSHFSLVLTYTAMYCCEPFHRKEQNIEIEKKFLFMFQEAGRIVKKNSLYEGCVLEMKTQEISWSDQKQEPT